MISLYITVSHSISLGLTWSRWYSLGLTWTLWNPLELTRTNCNLARDNGKYVRGKGKGEGKTECSVQMQLYNQTTRTHARTKTEIDSWVGLAPAFNNHKNDHSNDTGMSYPYAQIPNYANMFNRVIYAFVLPPVYPEKSGSPTMTQEFQAGTAAFTHTCGSCGRAAPLSS